MKNHTSRSITTLLIATGLAMLTAARATNESGKEAKEDSSERVTMGQLTELARATVEKLIAGGRIEKIDKEMEKGQTVYDVEANVNGKHMEYTITMAGDVVGTETSIEFNQLQDAVQAAAAEYFGGIASLEPSRVEENGQTNYEIEGKKSGKKVAVTFDRTGRIMGEEK
ncbi:MAG TPA: PepSY domain-containing protein [Verrucomicrobiae bacterium]|nr:PepSY domain-containing protein [Verrucomicrobiae bacterium]